MAREGIERINELLNANSELVEQVRKWRRKYYEEVTAHEITRAGAVAEIQKLRIFRDAPIVLSEGVALSEGQSGK